MYTIRQAIEDDSAQLAALRPILDAETENMDREPGEAHLDEAAWRAIIARDKAENNHLFLVAEDGGRLVAYCRCTGSRLVRLRHQAEFGVCVLKEYWGQGIGGEMLRRCITWAETGSRLHKLTLRVMATNTFAIKLYENQGFVQEGILRDDKRLSDGRYYDTLLMARIFK